MSQAGTSNMTGGHAAVTSLEGNDGVVVNPVGHNIQLIGVTVANGTDPLPLYVKSGGAGIEDIDIQLSKAFGSSVANNAGIASFNNTQFTVDANGYVSSLTGGFTWNNVTAASASMVAENGYEADRGTLVTLTLPATGASTFGDTIKIMGFGAGGWTIAQLAGQQIIVGSASSTVGVTGSVASTNQYDTLELVCSSTVGTWRAVNFVGNLIVT